MAPATVKAKTMPDLAADRVTAQVRALEALGAEELRVRWTEVYGAPPPSRWSPALLVRGIAHRLQEVALGGLAPALRRHLAGLAERLDEDPNASLAVPPRIKPGTRLLRQWHGDVHQVTVLEHGFAYRGERYGSLSAIARTITGVHWSGPAFFGLRPRRRVSGTRHA